MSSGQAIHLGYKFLQVCNYEYVAVPESAQMSTAQSNMSYKFTLVKWSYDLSLMSIILKTLYNQYASI